MEGREGGGKREVEGREGGGKGEKEEGREGGGKERWKGEREEGKVKRRRTIYAWALALSENRQDNQLTCKGISLTPS